MVPMLPMLQRTTGNVAYVTAEDATQNVAYGQVHPGTDDCYIGVGASLRVPITASSLQKSFLRPCVIIMWFNYDVNLQCVICVKELYAYSCF